MLTPTRPVMVHPQRMKEVIQRFTGMTGEGVSECVSQDETLCLHGQKGITAHPTEMKEIGHKETLLKCEVTAVIGKEVSL